MQHKYHVAPAGERHWRGRTWDSKAEMEYAQILYLLHDRGDLRVVIEQPRVILGVPENVDRPDFFVLPSESSGGLPEFIDVKGVETTAFRKIKKLWKAYGVLGLRIVKKNRGKFATVGIIQGGEVKSNQP